MAMTVYERRRIAVLAVVTTLLALVFATAGGSSDSQTADNSTSTTVAVTTTSTPLGVEVTIVNLNNGRSLRCTNVFAVTLPSGADVVIHTPLYLQIANLVDAPLPVTVSW